MPEEKIKLIKQLAIELLTNLGLNPNTVTVEQEDTLVKAAIELAANESGILVGFHGDTLSSFQLVLSLLVYKRLGGWQSLLVDVNQYRQQREQSLKRMALTAAQKVKFSGQPVVLPQLSALERRFIHTVLADNPDVITQSDGEGWSRRLTVKPKIIKVEGADEISGSTPDSASAQPAR